MTFCTKDGVREYLKMEIIILGIGDKEFSMRD